MCCWAPDHLFSCCLNSESLSKPTDESALGNGRHNGVEKMLVFAWVIVLPADPVLLGGLQ